MFRGIFIVGAAVLLFGLNSLCDDTEDCTVEAVKQRPVYGPRHDGTYIGCFKDTSDRAIPGEFTRQNDLTPEKCMAACRGKGTEFAAVQAGYACFCGNVYSKYGKMPESDCNSKCTGDPSRTCGGGWRNAVYRVKEKEAVEKYCERRVGAEMFHVPLGTKFTTTEYQDYHCTCGTAGLKCCRKGKETC